MATNWRRRLQERASRALPARLGRCAVLAGTAPGQDWPCGGGSALLVAGAAGVRAGVVRFAARMAMSSRQSHSNDLICGLNEPRPVSPAR
jgi:hypothetical protein